MVKRRRERSSEAPSSRYCSMMVAPTVSYHWSTRRLNASRPSSSLLVPSWASWRSITFWVAMAAWSVPGSQSTS